jgi:predicted transcriptional regulator
MDKMRKSTVREAMPKPNVLQLSEYDVTQKIMDSLVNPCHRAVLFSIVPESKIANQISDDLNISLSAVYKTLGKLEELTLVFVEKFEFKDGKKVKFYKSRIGNAEIALHGDDAILKLYPNKSAIDM